MTVQSLTMPGEQIRSALLEQLTTRFVAQGTPNHPNPVRARFIIDLEGKLNGQRLLGRDALKWVYQAKEGYQPVRSVANNVKMTAVSEPTDSRPRLAVDTPTGTSIGQVRSANADQF